MEAQLVDDTFERENADVKASTDFMEASYLVPCFFCCSMTPFRPNAQVPNFDLKIKALCKVVGISELLFGSKLEKSSFCDDCVGIIKTVSFINKSMETLRKKLNVQKNIILNLLTKPYQLETEVEERLYSTFSPSEIRKIIAQHLGVHAIIMEVKQQEKQQDLDNSVDTSPELLDYSYAESAPSSPFLDESHPNKMNIGITEPEKQSSSQTSAVNYTLPEGTLLKDCFIYLKKLSSDEYSAGRINKKRRSNKNGFSSKRTKKNARIRKSYRRPINPNNPVCCTHVDPQKGPCYKRFPNEEKMQMHVQLRHLKRKDLFKCPHCTRVLANKPSLTRHMMLHTGEGRLVCEVCGESFRSDYLLKQHEVKIHKKDYPYNCEVCSQGFVRLVEVKYHSYTHTGNWPLRCNVCNYGAVNKSQLYRHKLHNHVEEAAQLLPCPTCGKEFSSIVLLEKHSKRHVEVRAHLCTICPSTFKTSQDLKLHIKGVHTDERIHLCQLCGADFKTKRHLKNHLTGHDKRKLPFRKRNRQKNRIQSQLPQSAPVPDNRAPAPVESTSVTVVEPMPPSDDRTSPVERAYGLSFSLPELNPSGLSCFSNLLEHTNPNSTIFQ